MVQSSVQNGPLFKAMRSSRMLGVMPTSHVNHFSEINPKTMEILFIVHERYKSLA